MNAKQTVLDAYLARTVAIHAKLERLQQLADDHFDHDPDAIRGGCVGVMDCCSKPARQPMAMAHAQIMVAKGHVRVPWRRS